MRAYWFAPHWHFSTLLHMKLLGAQSCMWTVNSELLLMHPPCDVNLLGLVMVVILDSLSIPAVRPAFLCLHAEVRVSCRTRLLELSGVSCSRTFEKDIYWPFTTLLLLRWHFSCLSVSSFSQTSACSSDIHEKHIGLTPRCICLSSIYKRK